MLDRADTAAVRNADDNRGTELTVSAGMDLGQLSGDLVEGREHETVELNLTYGPVPAQGHPDGGSNNARFGQRRVHDSVLAKFSLQALSDPIHPAQCTNVLTHDEGLGVIGERGAQTFIDGLCHGHRTHAAPPGVCEVWVCAVWVCASAKDAS